jgi:hypothetical protein
MKAIVYLVLSCFLIPIPSLAQNVVVSVDKNKIISPEFGGIGFHSFHHVHPVSDKMWNEVVYKRWRELAPTFVRMNHRTDWTKDQLDVVIRHLKEYQKTGAEVYFATWDPQDIKSQADADAYAKKITDHFEYMVKTNHMDLVKYYCMSNELSLGEWGVLNKDMDKFRMYHRAFYDEFAWRNLKIQLLASDASPIERWNTIDWCAQNMDDITGVYGGHHYIDNHGLTDKSFYGWFYRKVKWGVDIARGKGKHFILGEFGPKQNNIVKLQIGRNMDKCQYYDTKDEAVSAIQVCSAITAAINAGVYAMGYWTFMDFPNAVPTGTYENKWGLTRWNGVDFSTRAPYYAVGLLTRYFGGGGTINAVATGDTLIHAAAVHHKGGKWSVAVINEKTGPARITLQLPEDIRMRKFVYDPSDVPQNPFGDLQPPSGMISIKGGKAEDILQGMSLVVYTSDFDETAPSAVKNVRVERTESMNRVIWDENSENDLCYYRVYRGMTADFKPSLKSQVASTIAASYTDELPASRNYYYKVVAVDKSGNPFYQ